MNQSPAFQFYAADYLADASVQMMSLEDEGCYIRLLAYCWREGSIPNDEAMIRRLCKGGSTTLMQMVEVCFNQSPTDATKLVHPRLEKEREKQRVWREKSAMGGKKSAEKRAPQQSNLKGGSKMVERVVEPKGNSSSSSSTSINSLPSSESLPSKAKARSIEEVLVFCDEIGIPRTDGDHLWHKWEGVGWKNGGAKIKDWKATIRAWKAAGYLPSQKSGNGFRSNKPTAGGKYDSAW